MLRSLIISVVSIVFVGLVFFVFVPLIPHILEMNARSVRILLGTGIALLLMMIVWNVVTVQTQSFRARLLSQLVFYAMGLSLLIMVMLGAWIFVKTSIFVS